MRDRNHVGNRSARLPAMPRGLSRAEAASYVGISPTMFDALVKDGRMPPPKRINARTIWDIRRLDDAFDAYRATRRSSRPVCKGGPKAQLMVDLQLKYVVEDVDRHGNVRVSFRRPGFAKIRLRGLPGSDQFQFAYAAALANTEIGAAPRKLNETDPKSMAWLCQHYYRSADFRCLNPRTRHVRRLILDGLCESGAGPLPYNRLTTVSIMKWRDAKSDRPEAANSLTKALRQLYAFAIEYGHVTRNPANGVTYLAGDPDGVHSWLDEEIRRFEACHPIGSRARLACALFALHRSTSV